MFLHFNPATPRLFTFVCPLSLAVAVVDRHAETLYPVSRVHLGTITGAHTATVAAIMTDFCEEPFDPKIVRTASVALPEWLAFSDDPDKLFIMRTSSPAFLSPIRNNMEVIRPIADSPTIPSEEMPAWLAKAQASLLEMTPVLLEIGETD